MCGIFGYVGKDDRPIPVARCRRLTNLLRHRGPDAGGYWSEGAFFLGNRRLSVIDVVNGKQPMLSADGRLVAIQNGEIYNYLEVRDTLRGLGHSFRFDSDTEVLLAGYQEWGVELASHLVGMFALAIVDRA